MQTRLTNTNTGPRAELDRELTAMRDDLLRLGDRVDTAIDHALTALLNHDHRLAREVIEADGLINARRYQLEEACLTLCATQQPVAGDLRRAIATMHAAGELERMADHAAGIANIAIQLGAGTRLPLANLERIAQVVRRMLRNSVYAFAYSDLEQADRTAQLDDQIDQFQQQMVRMLLTYMMEDREVIAEATYLLWVAHNLERIGDHCVNLCQRTPPR